MGLNLDEHFKYCLKNALVVEILPNSYRVFGICRHKWVLKHLNCSNCRQIISGVSLTMIPF